MSGTVDMYLVAWRSLTIQEEAIIGREDPSTTCEGCSIPSDPGSDCDWMPMFPTDDISSLLQQLLSSPGPDDPDDVKVFPWMLLSYQVSIGALTVLILEPIQ